MLLAYIYRSMTHRVHFLDKASRDLFICAKTLLVETNAPQATAPKRLSQIKVLNLVRATGDRRRGAAVRCRSAGCLMSLTAAPGARRLKCGFDEFTTNERWPSGQSD